MYISIWSNLFRNLFWGQWYVFGYNVIIISSRLERNNDEYYFLIDTTRQL